MLKFDVIWTLYNPALKRSVDAPNNSPLEAESIEEAWGILTGVEFPRPNGLQIIGVHLKERDVDVRTHIDA